MSIFKNNLCEKGKADDAKAYLKAGNATFIYNRHGRLHFRDGLFV